MAEERGGPKIGEGALAAFGRQGLKELAQVLPAFPDSVRPVEEAGMFGNPTPQIVTKEMGAGYQDMLREAALRTEPEQERGMGMER
jgi:hypothetical protein